MKKIISLLLCCLLLITSACGKTNEEVVEPDKEIVGADWRTYKAYGFSGRVVDGMLTDVYVELVPDTGVVRLIEDDITYTIIQELKVMHEPIFDAAYIENNVTFEDCDGDDVEDVIIFDMDGDKTIAEVFLFDENAGEYVYSETVSTNETIRMNASAEIPGDYEFLHVEYRDIVEAEASTSPEHLYRLYDIDGNGYRELIIQTGDDGAFEIYYPLYDGDKVVGALSAGVIPGSEDGTFAYDDEYTLIMNRFVQGARYVYTINLSEGELVIEETYAAEEEEYGFDGTELELYAVTNEFDLYE